MSWRRPHSATGPDAHHDHRRRRQHRLAKDLRKIQPPASVAAGSDEVREPNRDASSLGPGSHVSHGSLSGVGDVDGEGVDVLVVEKGGRWEPEAEISDDEDDSSVDSEEDAPFTYEQLQARTLAARAAVNLLLPNRTDDMAGRDGPYGMRRAGRERRCVRVYACVCRAGVLGGGKACRVSLMV